MRLLNRDLNLQDVTVMYLTTLATLVVILVASFQAGSAPGATLPYHIPLDPNGNLQLSWNISYTQQELYLKLRVSHLQYGVVLGMSDRGEIFNADLVVLWSDGKRSYFGYESVVTRGNEAIVHHMEVFECAAQLENVPQYSGSCDSKMKPRKLN